MKKIFHHIASYITHTDIWLWLICLSLSTFSLVLLAGIAQMEVISFHRVAVQGAAAAIGVCVAIFLSKMDYHLMTKLWKLHTIAAYMLVIMTFFFGTGAAERLGDKSWFQLPGGMSFQPSELLKVSFILTLAYHIYTVREHINQPHHLIGICLHGAVPVLLIHIQGDDGSALVFACIFVGMLFAAGISWKYVAAAAAAGIAAAPLVWMFVLEDYQKQRFLAILDPNANPRGVIHQQYLARLTIGSGQVWGKGIFNADHKYIPEMETDFIFSFIAESLGFVGSLALIAAFIFLCVKILMVGHRSHDLQGHLICAGVFSMIAAQCVVNIGMCISVLPVIGITLPFLSSGGSSLVMTYLGIGLVLSVYMNTSKSIFDDS